MGNNNRVIDLINVILEMPFWLFVILLAVTLGVIRLALRAGRKDKEEEHVCNWLRVALIDGPRLSNDITRDAMVAGISKRTLEGAKDWLKVKRATDDSGRLWLCLRDDTFLWENELGEGKE